jgi:hypothetical protein
MTSFGGAVNCNNFFHILFFTSLHVSASTGHPQVKYVQSFLKLLRLTAHPKQIIVTDATGCNLQKKLKN